MNWVSLISRQQLGAHAHSHPNAIEIVECEGHALHSSSRFAHVLGIEASAENAGRALQSERRTAKPHFSSVCGTATW